MRNALEGHPRFHVRLNNNIVVGRASEDQPDALRVDDIDAALAELKEKGVRLIDQTPRYGAGGARIAFVHPKASHGVLLELCERK